MHALEHALGYPILALPIWKESLRQIRQVPEEWWILLREKLKGQEARAIFEGAILSYCDDLAALIEIQVEAVVNGAIPREIAQKREEGRSLVLLLQGLVRFGLPSQSLKLNVFVTSNLFQPLFECRAQRCSGGISAFLSHAVSSSRTMEARC
jgi:hypothetical protein